MQNIVGDGFPYLARNVGTLRCERGNKPGIGPDHVGGYRNLTITASCATSYSDRGNSDVVAYFFSNRGNYAFKDDCEATSCLERGRTLQKGRCLFAGLSLGSVATLFLDLLWEHSQVAKDGDGGVCDCSQDLHI